MREILRTYEVVVAYGGALIAIRCHLCGLASSHPDDVARKYCGRCHVFHDDLAIARAAHVRGEVPHACAAWRLVVGGIGVCAVCARTLDPAIMRSRAEVQQVGVGGSPRHARPDE